VRGAVVTDPEIDDATRKLVEHWNIAESRIKKAEQVRANEVVAAAIFELRYAGRKYIDATSLLQSGSTEPAVRQKILEYLADATEDCVKAKHDAIDSILDFVTSWFDRTENKLGLTSVQHFFPNYIVVTAKIADIQDKIADSRADRTKLRDSIYDRIDNEDYDETLALYKTMKLSEARVEAEVQAETRAKEEFVLRQVAIQREGRINLAIGVAGGILAVVGLILTLATILRTDQITPSLPQPGTSTSPQVPNSPRAIP